MSNELTSEEIEIQIAMFKLKGGEIEIVPAEDADDGEKKRPPRQAWGNPVPGGSLNHHS